MNWINLRIALYACATILFISSLPVTGEVKESNIITAAIWLRGDIQAVTLPWRGILIKPGITGYYREVILEHEQCHVNQINKLGWFDFMIEYQKDPLEFESECYNN